MKTFKLWLLILFVFNCCLTAFAEDNYSQLNNTEPVRTILDTLSISAMAPDVFNRWNDYLLETTHYGYKEHADTIRKLYNDYYKSIADYGHCCEDLEKEKKNNYNPEWISRLRDTFDNAYLKRNTDIIEAYLKSLYFIADLDYCKSYEKEILYTELHATAVLQRYLKIFLEFYSTAKKEDQVRMNDIKSLAESFSELANQSPMRDLLSDSGVRIALVSNQALIKEKLDQDLKAFLDSYPFFFKPFDLLRALKDLRMLQ